MPALDSLGNRATSERLSVDVMRSGSTRMKGEIPTGGLGAPVLLFILFSGAPISANTRNVSAHCLFPLLVSATDAHMLHL